MATAATTANRLPIASTDLTNPLGGRDRWWRLWGVAMLLAGAAWLTRWCDADISAFVRGCDMPGDLRKAIELSEAFAHGLGAAAILLSVLWLARDRRHWTVLAIVITLTSGVAANGLKACFVRVRPHSEGQIAVVGSVSESPDLDTVVERVSPDFWDARQRSFPSGHAATAWGLAIGLSLVFPEALWWFVSLASLASLQRIQSGAHYTSDVLAGAMIAFLAAGLVLVWHRGSARR